MRGADGAGSEDLAVCCCVTVGTEGGVTRRDDDGGGVVVREVEGAEDCGASNEVEGPATSAGSGGDTSADGAVPEPLAPLALAAPGGEWEEEGCGSRGARARRGSQLECLPAVPPPSELTISLEPPELSVVLEPYGSSELCTDMERPWPERLTRLGESFPGSTLVGSAW